MTRSFFLSPLYSGWSVFAGLRFAELSEARLFVEKLWQVDCRLYVTCQECSNTEHCAWADVQVLNETSTELARLYERTYGDSAYTGYQCVDKTSASQEAASGSCGSQMHFAGLILSTCLIFGALYLTKFLMYLATVISFYMQLNETCRQKAANKPASRFKDSFEDMDIHIDRSVDIAKGRGNAKRERHYVEIDDDRGPVLWSPPALGGREESSHSQSSAYDDAWPNSRLTMRQKGYFSVSDLRYSEGGEESR